MRDDVPDSRAYVHTRCGQTTIVDGADFKNVACPIPGVVTTFCSPCGAQCPIAEFEWADSGENIAAYYERHSTRIPDPTRLLCSYPLAMSIMLFGFLAGVAIGVWSSSSLGYAWGIAIGIGASLVGAVASLLVWISWTRRILSATLGVRDIRCLD